MKSEMKEMLKRALRTFVQAALGYLCANLAVSVSGVSSGNESLRSVLITLFTAAVACGLSAVMNLPKKGECGCGEGAEASGSVGNDGSGGASDGDVTENYSGGFAGGASEGDEAGADASMKIGEKEDEDDG